MKRVLEATRGKPLFALILALLPAILQAGSVFVAKYESQADVKVFFVPYESQADIKVHFVRHESQAGWRAPSPFQGRLGAESL